MTKKTSPKKINAPLVVEPYPKDYSGYPFITLIQYRKHHVLTIVDNTDEETIMAYVLDLCGPESVNEQTIIDVAAGWFKTNFTIHPLSIEFCIKGMGFVASKIYRRFNVEYVSRVIGPVPHFPLKEVRSVKRRRRKPIPSDVEITRHVLSFEKLSK